MVGPGDRGVWGTEYKRGDRKKCQGPPMIGCWGDYSGKLLKLLFFYFLRIKMKGRIEVGTLNHKTATDEILQSLIRCQSGNT